MTAADVSLMIFIASALQQLWMKGVLVVYWRVDVAPIFLQAHAAKIEFNRTFCDEIYYCYILDVCNVHLY